MKLQYVYRLSGDLIRLIPELVIVKPTNGDPLVGGKFNRYAYYLSCPLDWWFPTKHVLVEKLTELQRLEAGKIREVQVISNDSFLEITLDGAQSSNLSDDSVTDQPEGRFTYQEVKTIFLKYKEFLEMPVSLDSTLEFEL